MVETPKVPDHAGEPLLELNLGESSDLKLARYCDRVAHLLKSPKAQGNQYLVATLDDLLGAVYALIFAKHNTPAFIDRAGQIEVPVIVKRAEQAALGRIRLAGAWLAGFHFNGALFRLAATYHRGMKVATRKENDNIYKSDLLNIVKPAFQGWEGAAWNHSELDRIYVEVNELKHDAEGLFQERKVTLADAELATEELIVLFEAWIRQP